MWSADFAPTPVDKNTSQKVFMSSHVLFHVLCECRQFYCVSLNHRKKTKVDKSFAYLLNVSLNFTFEHQLSFGKGSY